jgi:hypothetical protein
MPLPTSGPISMSAINQELGLSSNTTNSLGNANVRTLGGAATGRLNLASNFYGRNASPVWSTASGSLGSNFTQRSSSFNALASSLFGVTYSLVSGSLPPGQSLNTSTGTISGTPSGVADFSNTTFNFTLRARSNGLTVATDRAFSINIASRYVGFRCSTTSEGGSVGDTAPPGMVFNRVDFSSYGNPDGSCGAFTFGWCNAGSSNGYNPTPTTSYSVAANNGTWGDPCGGTFKRMYVQMSFGPF